MRITDFILLQYNLSFTKPFFVKGFECSNRVGIVIKLVTDKGEVGLGEVSPLPGFSKESIKEASYHVQRIKDAAVNLIVPENIEDLSFFLEKVFSLSESPSSVKFGVESAFFQLISQVNNQSVSALLGKEPKDVLVGGLLQGSLRDIENKVVDLKARNCKTYKLKVGNKNIPLDVDKVDLVRRVIPEDGRIRLDANQSWSFKEAVLFAKHVGTDQIEFIEDPFKDVSRYDQFFKETNFPVALDETVTDISFEQALESCGIQYFVLKPTVIGGIFETLTIIKKAKELSKKVVISSSFESGIGVSLLANLANLTGQVAGLGTLDWFEQDLLKFSLINAEGVVESENLMFQNSAVNFSLLEDFSW